MLFDKGIRVKITDDVTGGVRKYATVRNIKGMQGVLVSRLPHSASRWAVKIDGDPGYITQGDCWHVYEHQMMPIEVKTNKEAAHLLLDREY